MSRPSQAFDEAFVECYDRLVGQCRRNLPPGLGDPEDFVHLVYLKCRKSWQSDRWSRRSSISYFCRALRCVIIDAARSRARRRVHERRQVTTQRTAEGGRSLAELVAREALDSLPAQQKQACLAILLGKGVEHAKRLCRMDSNAFSVYLCRARARLSREFQT